MGSKNLYMKFIVSSSALLKQAQHVAGVIGNNTVLPILSDFLFEIEGGNLSIVATDLETVIRENLPVESKETGKICIPAKILVDTLKNIPDQPLTFDIDQNFGIEITSDNGKYKVMGESAANFPKEPVAEDTDAISIPAHALITAITKTIFATSNDDLRPAMNGVLLELSNKGIQFVATDAHRLVKYLRKDAISKTTTSIIVPKKPLTLIKNVIQANNDILELSFNSNHLFIKHDTTLISCRLIEARFPDYKVVIPTDNPYTLTVNKNEFQSALRRVSIFSNKSNNLVVLNISGSELQLTAQDIDFSFEGNERMNCQYDGEDMAIAFNSRFMLDMVMAIDGEELKIELSTPSKAGLLKPVEAGSDEDLLMLAMPLLINQ